MTKKFTPEEVVNSIPNRYIVVKNKELGDNFFENPLAIIADTNKEYRELVEKHDHVNSAMYNDWAIRVDLNDIENIGLEKLDTHLLNKYIVFRGVVVRARQHKPMAIRMTYLCQSGHEISCNPEERPPIQCPQCKTRGLEVETSLCEFINSQNVRLAEPFDEIDGSRQPTQLDCRVDGSLVETVQPGEKCLMGGILTAKYKKQEFEYEFLVNNIVPFKPVKDFPVPKIPEKEDIMQYLVDSFAPHILGYATIKEAVLLLMVGGFDPRETGRSDINVLLVGDPGIAKSTILQEASKVAPLGRYTSGRGSTAAGLTAGIVRDKSGVMYMEAGAAVMANDGVLCLDEFDKMREADRSALHEVMEQQTVSRDLAGTSVTLNARVSILAAANPKGSRWDDTKPLADNIDLPDTLLTRFDLIYMLKDTPNEDRDERIAKHILTGTTDTPLTRDELTGYINEARKRMPLITKDASEVISQYYVDERSRDGELSVTARQLEAVRRLATARAKILNHKSVSVDDATRAIFLVKTMIERTLIDPETGKPDHAKAMGGSPKLNVRDIDEIASNIEGEFTANDILNKAPGMKMGEIEKMLEKLHEASRIIEKKPGLYEHV